MMPGSRSEYAHLQGLEGGGDPANFETFDIYLLPPGEDIETCASWLRMRNREGRYQLMFEEWVVDGPFIITPRISFEVLPACVLALPMGLGFRVYGLLSGDEQHLAAHCCPSWRSRWGHLLCQPSEWPVALPDPCSVRNARRSRDAAAPAWMGCCQQPPCSSAGQTSCSASMLCDWHLQAWTHAPCG